LAAVSADMHTTDHIREKLRSLPDKPGAYMMRNAQGEVIYVGKAVSLRSRVRSYFQKGQTHGPKTVVLVSKIADLDWMVTDTEVEALMLECNLIKKYRPYYNIRLRDDKHYPYLCATTSEPFPRVIVVRRSKRDQNRYFGPYVDSAAMRETLSLLRKVFHIRSCNKKLTGSEKDRPCLNHHLGQCDSPCAGLISKDEYTQLVKDACLFLEGKQESLIKDLDAKMSRAAEELEFERAARLRDQLNSVRAVIEKQKVINTENSEQDVISITESGGSFCVHVLFVRSGKLIGQEYFFLEPALDETIESGLQQFLSQYYRDAAYVPSEILISHEIPERQVIEDWLTIKRGAKVVVTTPQRGVKRRMVEMASENAELTAERENRRRTEDREEAEADMEDLKTVLHLPDLPCRIETYDISNIQGKQAVASMVVFEGGVPAKSEYRRFKIRSGEVPDDYGMMREALLRRFAAARDENPKFTKLPDLMVIDGGKGQLSAALEAARIAGMDVRIVSLAKRFEEIYTPESMAPILLPRDSRALRLLQRTRDEAHRFALAYHHQLREKVARKSVLDDIQGIGDQRRKALIRKFGSLAGVRAASVEEISSVPGINQTIAQSVYDALHGEGE